MKHKACLAAVLVALVLFSLVQPAPGERPTPAFIQTQKQLSVLAMVNMILGVVVLFLAAVLQ